MAKKVKPSDLVWSDFDKIMASEDFGSTPWAGGQFVPDYALLARLIEVPLRHKITTQSGMHAKALDVWAAHELRRAGFPPDEVWPRIAVPRVLPREVGLLRAHSKVLKATRKAVFERIDRGDMGGGVSAANANILGAAYVKQVDVAMARWSTGPEIMISTKRMDSSFGNNAANRIEESYGDARNLRGRYPLAAIGYLFGLRSTGFTDAKSSIMRLNDLLAKMGSEPDGYDATGLVVIDYDDAPDDNGSYNVRIDPNGACPAALDPARFLATIVKTVLDRTPVDFHKDARERHGEEVPEGPSDETPTDAPVDPAEQPIAVAE